MAGKLDNIAVQERADLSASKFRIALNELRRALETQDDRWAVFNFGQISDVIRENSVFEKNYKLFINNLEPNLVVRACDVIQSAAKRSYQDSSYEKLLTELCERSIQIKRLGRRLPPRFVLTENPETNAPRTALRALPDRITTLQKAVLGFSKVNVVINLHSYNYLTTLGNLIVREFPRGEPEPLVSSNATVYTDLLQYGHVTGSLLNVSRSSITLLVLNTWTFDSDTYFRIKSADLTYTGLKVKVFVFPNDALGNRNEFDLQDKDECNFKKGQCQDWSLLICWLFAKSFGTGDALDQTIYYSSGKVKPDFVRNVAKFYYDLYERTRTPQEYSTIWSQSLLFGGHRRRSQKRFKRSPRRPF